MPGVDVKHHGVGKRRRVSPRGDERARGPRRALAPRESCGLPRGGSDSEAHVCAPSAVFCGVLCARNCGEGSRRAGGVPTLFLKKGEKKQKKLSASASLRLHSGDTAAPPSASDYYLFCRSTFYPSTTTRRRAKQAALAPKNPHAVGLVITAAPPFPFRHRPHRLSSPRV